MVFQVLGIVVDGQPGQWQVWSLNGLNKPQHVRVYPGPTHQYILAMADGKNTQEEHSLSLAV